jgi:hypothetical protein
LCVLGGTCARERDPRVRRKGKRGRVAYFGRSNNQRIPIHPRQHVKQELRVWRDGVGDELAVLGV